MDFDRYLIEVANTVRIKSKDPSTQVGAVIVSPEKGILSTGFNGFPRGINEADPERWERPLKYQYVVHAEVNAIYNAARHGISLRGCTMYILGFGPPTVPCSECAKAVIQVGIARVVGFPIKRASKAWAADIAFAQLLLVEAGVVIKELKGRLGDSQ